MAADEVPPSLPIGHVAKYVKSWYTVLGILFGAGVAIVTFFASFATNTAVEKAVAPVHAQAIEAARKADGAATAIAVEQVRTIGLQQRTEEIVRVQLMQGEQLLELARSAGARRVPALSAVVAASKRDVGAQLRPEVNP